MIVLHQFEISPFCDKIRRVLHVKRVPYEVREVPLLDTITGRVRRLNPAGKVPCIEENGQFVADSTEIAHYAEKRWPDPPLLPADPAARSLCHVLEDWADESLYFYEMLFRFTRPANARRWVPKLLEHDAAPVRATAGAIVPRVIGRRLAAQGVGLKSLDAAVRDLDRHIEAVDGLLASRPFLVTSALTLADISVFAQLACIRGTEEGEKAIAPRPRVAEWMARVDAATTISGR
jgi:glutathione S-transferase